jgi:hypothetical protein
METISDVIAKTEHKSLYAFMGVIDPDHKIAWSKYLIETWNRLTLTEQRRLYLYCLYRKWRGEGFFNTPQEIILLCHPYPTNWNGRQMLNRLMKETKMVRAKYDGNYGIFTLDEARVWQMTDIKPLNF